MLHTIQQIKNMKQLKKTTSSVEVLCKAVSELSTESYYVYDKTSWSYVKKEEKVGTLATNGDLYTYGVKYSCDLGTTDNSKNLNFFVLAQNGNEVSLILDRNYDETAQWYCDESKENNYYNTCNGDGLTSKLNEIKVSWSKLNESQISIPTAEQIVTAANTTLESPNFDLAKWLIININTNNGSYWTSTPDSSANVNEYVVSVGSLTGTAVSSGGLGGSSNTGIRPVITILKTQLG